MLRTLSVLALTFASALPAAAVPPNVVMIVGDDPMTWFYFNWSFASLPAIVVLWFANKGPDLSWNPSAASAAAAG